MNDRCSQFFENFGVAEKFNENLGIGNGNENKNKNKNEDNFNDIVVIDDLVNEEISLRKNEISILSEYPSLFDIGFNEDNYCNDINFRFKIKDYKNKLFLLFNKALYYRFDINEEYKQSFNFTYFDEVLLKDFDSPNSNTNACY